MDESPEELSKRIDEVRSRLAPELPEIDPGDLIVILHGILRPFGSGKRFILRELRPGVHVP